MKKIIFQGIILVAGILALYLSIALVPWKKLFHVNELITSSEKKLGDIFWNTFNKENKECTDPYITQSVDSMVLRICEHNNFNRADFQLHIIENDMVNAFALPDGHIVVLTGLINESENPEELAGVLAHEMAHLKLDHVVKKIMKEVGVTILLSITTGNADIGATRELIKLLASTGFDRKFEEEADLKAVDYLAKANINPIPFADFLFRLAQKESDLTAYTVWVNTHPETKERVKKIISHQKKYTYTYLPVLSSERWIKTKNLLTN